MKLELGDVIKSHMASVLPNIYTSMPAKVTKVGVSGTQVVVDAQPLVNRVEPDGNAYETGILPEVPVVFPAGGGAMVSFPIAENDTVLLVFSMRSIEEFLSSDGSMPQTPFSRRNHSLSDAVAIPGLFTSVNSPQVSTTDLQLRNGIGETESNIDVKPDGKIVINAASAVEIGEGAAESLVLGDAFKSYFDGHTHPTGVGPSGPPAAPMPPTTLSTYAKTN